MSNLDYEVNKLLAGSKYVCVDGHIQIKSDGNPSWIPKLPDDGNLDVVNTKQRCECYTCEAGRVS